MELLCFHCRKLIKKKNELLYTNIVQCYIERKIWGNKKCLSDTFLSQLSLTWEVQLSKTSPGHFPLFKILTCRRKHIVICGWETNLIWGFMMSLYLLPTDTVSKAKGIISRVVRLAQRYLLDPISRERAEEKSSQTQTKPRQQSPAPGQVQRSLTSASFTQTQVNLCYKCWLCSLV